MKLFVSILATVALFAAFAVQGASAQQPCSERALLKASSGLGASAFERYGLEVFVFERCGKRSRIPFG